jgi:hypothetical protein
MGAHRLDASEPPRPHMPATHLSLDALEPLDAKALEALRLEHERETERQRDAADAERARATREMLEAIEEDMRATFPNADADADAAPVSPPNGSTPRPPDGSPPVLTISTAAAAAAAHGGTLPELDRKHQPAPSPRMTPRRQPEMVRPRPQAACTLPPLCIKAAAPHESRNCSRPSLAAPMTLCAAAHPGGGRRVVQGRGARVRRSQQHV